MSERGWRSWASVWLASLGFWLLLAILASTQSYVAGAYRGRPITWQQAIPYPATFYLTWAALTPLLLWWSARLPTRPWPAFVGVHLATGAVASFVHARTFVAVLPRLQPDTWPGAAPDQVVMNLFVANFHTNLLLYATVVAATLAFGYYRRSRERELRASRMEARLAQAELQVLKMQLQPHFLFNTLHAISALVHEDPDAADETIANLADLLRLTLDAHGVQELPLRRELEFLDHYLKIETTRLGDRLRVRRDVPAALLDAMVPNLILQPLVENAIRHGIAPRPEGGSVAISASREDGVLRLEVRDDGPGPRLGRVREGVGLANTRARLQQLYGGGERLRLDDSGGKGFVVRLTIPLRLAPSARLPDAP